MLKVIGVGKLAKKYHIQKGDTILKIGGFKAIDILDYLYFDSLPSFDLEVKGQDGTIRTIQVNKQEGQTLELTFQKDEEIRTCHNHCIFCFVDQMKEGMRPSLYVKDDDDSMSFVCGNFVTLTNVDDEGIDRIIRLHLSPLYVSVHTMNESLRCKMLGNRFAGKITSQMQKLAQGDITMHCQAVIVPELNDGKELEYTARQLFALYPAVNDMAVVPTGITRYRDGLYPIRDFTKEEAEQLLDLCDKLNAEFGVNFLLPADEYYIRADRPFKTEEFYGDYSQIENGIGMTTKFIDDFTRAIKPTILKKPKHIAVISGVSASPIIGKLLQQANANVQNLHAFVLPVQNAFFGETVTCTGLLVGQDILSALQTCATDFDTVIIPSNTLKQFQDIFLDDMTVADLRRALKGKKVVVNRDPSQLFQTLIKG